MSPSKPKTEAPPASEGPKLLKFILAKYKADFPRPVSLRSTAVHLGFSAAYLSQLLSGKRPLTHKAASKIAKAIQLTPTERHILMLIAQNEALGSEKHTPAVHELLRKSGVNFVAQDPDVLRVISEWYHVAILEMTFLPDVVTVGTVTKRLGISKMMAAAALKRLKKLGLLVADPKGRLIKNESNTAFATSTSDTAYSNFTKQMIRLGLDSVDNQEVTDRLIATYTLPIHKSQLPEARKMMREFARRMLSLCKAQESDQSVPDPDAIFQLNVQFFNLTDGRKKSAAND